jgi:hypothetical protein
LTGKPHGDAHNQVEESGNQAINWPSVKIDHLDFEGTWRSLVEQINTDERVGNLDKVAVFLWRVSYHPGSFFCCIFSHPGSLVHGAHSFGRSLWLQAWEWEPYLGSGMATCKLAGAGGFRTHLRAHGLHPQINQRLSRTFKTHGSQLTSQ